MTESPSAVESSDLNTETSVDPKGDLRRRAKRNRASISVDHRRVCDALRRFLDRSELPGYLVVFDALPGEPNVADLFNDTPSRRLALTRTPAAGHQLTVHDGRALLEPHRFGFRQPVADAPVIADDAISAVLVPGLAFDRVGGRLGFGAGFYDRFLGRLPSGVIKIGVSDGFIVDRVPTDGHDVAMTHLATEAGVMALPLSSATTDAD